jgi:hypothetical protein
MEDQMTLKKTAKVAFVKEQAAARAARDAAEKFLEIVGNTNTNTKD